MNRNRRRILGLGAISLTAALLSGCESLEQRLTPAKLPPDSLPPVAGNPRPAVRLLNRLAYGPRPGDIAHVERIGPTAWIDQQLHPDQIAESPVAAWRVGALADTLHPDTGLLFDEDDHRLVTALRQATILRAVYSRHQLYERMVEFWSDHFNIYAFKGEGPQLTVVDDHDTIRKYALGKFRDLLGASARSAAMLGYLDNNVNIKGIPNENYARELMELHTLGVHGGYTQHDVKDVARCLTGWTSEKLWHRGRFLFDAARHDNGVKHVLGLTIPAGGGVTDGERVLDLLAAHPSTAHHLARKLCVHFLGAVSDTEVNRLALVFLRTHGDISATLRALLISPDLLTAGPILKSPLDYVVSALRAFNADTDGGPGIQSHLEKMGQPLFAWPMPDGFPDNASAWTGALIPRWNFALELAANRIENTSLNSASLAAAGARRSLGPHDALLEFAFGDAPADPRHAALARQLHASADTAEAAAIILMSPDFQWR